MKSFYKYVKEHLFTIFVILFFTILFITICCVAYNFIYLPYTASFNHQIAPVAAKSLETSSQLRAEWGQLGDYFGGTLNPIFGFASFMALLVTILYQAKELNASTKELRNSAKALAAQNKAIELQSFEQTFFSWLNTYRSLLDSVERQTNYNSQPLTLNGRRALHQFWERQFHSLNDQIARGNFLTEAEIIPHSKQSWDNTYNENEFQLDSLFRTLYRLLLWVDQNTKLNPSEKWLYISIVRSQLSWIEMVYLYHNCLTERGRKFKPLVEKYGIFDNLVFNNDKTLTSLQSEYLDEAFSSDLARKKLCLENSTYPLAAPST